MSSMTIFALGGTGINIAKELYRPEVCKEPGFAPFKTVFIDTSRSNVPEGVDNFIHIKDPTGALTKGSGKVRSTNYEAASVHLQDVLKEAKPSDINVIIHSASGGTGSVLGNMMVSSFLAQGKDVVILMVGSTTCRQEIVNTINTIKSYQSVALTRKKPVICHYLENGKMKMVDNDASIQLVSILLTAIWSDENHGLDEQDLHNFLNYQYVSNYKPGLAQLDILTNGEVPNIGKGQAISSVLSMIRDGEDPDPGLTVGYHSFGTFSQEASESIKMETPIHLHTVQGYYASILKELQEKLKEIDEYDRSNVVSHIEIEEDEAQSDGVIL